MVGDYHKKFRLKRGISKAELFSKFKINQKELAVIIDLIVSNNALKIQNNFISLYDFEVKYDVNQLKEKNNIEKILLESKFTPPNIKDLTKNNKGLNELLSSLAGDTIIILNEDIAIHVKTFEEAKNKVLKHFENNKKLTLAEFRDFTGSSRKYSLPILEYMDKQGITKRVEDYRVLGK